MFVNCINEMKRSPETLMKTMAKKNTNGFTLIELLVALAVGAGIILLAQQALSGAINTEARVNQSMKSVNGMQRTWQLLGDDLLHAIPRQSVDQFGNTQAAMAGLLSDRLSQSSTLAVNDDSYLLRFVRGGDENFFELPRSDLYMVGYRLTVKEDTGFTADESEGNIRLWRDHWRPIDSANEPNVKRRLLLDNIKTIQFRYLSGNSQTTEDQAWITGWPESVAQNDQLPIAVEVTIDVERIGEVKRIFLLSDG